jgi:predicted O-methyltransferase YrrM
MRWGISAILANAQRLRKVLPIEILRYNAVMTNMTWEEIPGWTNFQDVYDAAVEESRDGAVFVEVGTWLGRSAAYMATKIQESEKKIRFFAVDNFEGSPEEAVHASTMAALQEQGTDLESACRKNLQDCGLDKYVRIVKDQSWIAAEGFADGSVDFCMIDASHEYRFVKRDIEAWLPKIKPGGVIAGDDLDEPGVKQAVQEVFGDQWMSSKKRWPSWIYHVPRISK